MAEHTIREGSTGAAAFAAAARRAVAYRTKMQARLYAKRPLMLDTLHSGLSSASPATLLAVAEHLLERESRSPRRWFGFGGEVTLINARAVLLLARARRRSASYRASILG